MLDLRLRDPNPRLSSSRAVAPCIGVVTGSGFSPNGRATISAGSQKLALAIGHKDPEILSRNNGEYP